VFGFLFYWGLRDISLFLQDTEVLVHLKEKEESGVTKLQAGNGHKVSLVPCTSSHSGESSSTISRLNGEVFTFLGAQGDLEARLREFVVHPKVAAAAVSELYIPGRLDAKATRDFSITLSLTLEQMRGMRQLGVGLASEKAIAQEEAARQLPMLHRKVRLEGKPRGREAHTTVNVSFV